MSQDQLKKLQSGQFWPHGAFSVDAGGRRVRRTLREYLCDLLTGGHHLFLLDWGGHTWVGNDGPCLARPCRICGNRIQWGH